ncbi:hypothetical protein SERLA73DRAFT_130144 [Serpula lacrymans var. lacrymans S7.3]|uniref:Uncharacterized protein n=1 Tax=Serpula lacrymans var. lacrymans (strain S7.3) TaxID=936435 RepID=F8PIR4_SERL3|nr:hypothetical protein SERLA73DRAFT_130144 [Serpula lacrymans var. lacrymans S7.3]
MGGCASRGRAGAGDGEVPVGRGRRGEVPSDQRRLRHLKTFLRQGTRRQRHRLSQDLWGQAGVSWWGVEISEKGKGRCMR